MNKIDCKLEAEHLCCFDEIAQSDFTSIDSAVLKLFCTNAIKRLHTVAMFPTA